MTVDAEQRLDAHDWRVTRSSQVAGFLGGKGRWIEALALAPGVSASANRAILISRSRSPSSLIASNSASAAPVQPLPAGNQLPSASRIAPNEGSPSVVD